MASPTTPKTSTPTYNPMVAHKRKEKDVTKLLMSDYKVTQSKTDQYNFIVGFDGPKGSLYEGGKYNVQVWLPDTYPYKSPSIGFRNRIYHPNIDEVSGTVCLDVINQAWSPMFDLINIFDTFLPQLLLYPNPTDPLNPEAAILMMKFPDKYEQKAKEYVEKYAKATKQDTKMNTAAENNSATDDDQIDVENESQDNVSLSDVSDLSDTSNIEIMEA